MSRDPGHTERAPPGTGSSSKPPPQVSMASGGPSSATCKDSAGLAHHSFAVRDYNNVSSESLHSGDQGGELRAVNRLNRSGEGPRSGVGDRPSHPEGESRPAEGLVLGADGGTVGVDPSAIGEGDDFNRRGQFTGGGRWRELLLSRPREDAKSQSAAGVNAHASPSAARSCAPAVARAAAQRGQR